MRIRHRAGGRAIAKIQPLSASRQVLFHQLLVAARKTVLGDALSETLASLDPKKVKSQIQIYVPADVQKILAVAGIRDEYVFPSPIVLEARPSLLGYYRLLLGISQKAFYETRGGRGRFKGMEEKGRISPSHKAHLPDLCRVMGDALADLVRQISPSITIRDVKELPLLTIGSQFQGANNVNIGKRAVEAMQLSVREIVKSYVVREEASKIVVKNASGRLVSIVFGADPDVRIEEEVGDGQIHPKVAIEVKGGTDTSNAHNRAGEAEKSHQKAKRRGFNDFWTVIAEKGLDLKKLKDESPTTNKWLDVSQVLGRQGQDWDEFKRSLAVAVGIPLDE